MAVAASANGATTVNFMVDRFDWCNSYGYNIRATVHTNKVLGLPSFFLICHGNDGELLLLHKGMP